MARRAYEELTPDERAAVDAVRARHRTEEWRAEAARVREEARREVPPMVKRGVTGPAPGEDVPDLAGLTEAEAGAALEAHGLRLRVLLRDGVAQPTEAGHDPGRVNVWVVDGRIDSVWPRF